jgi:protein-S-isoprenylcysteine O-methyltransferase Ste14
MISLFERLANSLLRTATGDPGRRWLLTPLVGLLFLCFLTLFFVASFAVDRWLTLPSIVYFPWTLVLSLVMLIPGAFFYGWSVILFVRAHGTPVPINPPRELVVSGPYKFSRNPMMLGIYLVFLGIGMLVGSLALTLIFTPLLIILMTVYVKKVEEKELELQFGQEYLDYRKKVGIYFPHFGHEGN